MQTTASQCAHAHELCACAGVTGPTEQHTVPGPHEWLTPQPHMPAEGILQSPVPLQKQKWLMFKEVGQWRKKYNLGNSQGKKIYCFNKSLGIERLLFHQRSKLYVRTMGSYLSPGLE